MKTEPELKAIAQARKLIDSRCKEIEPMLDVSQGGQFAALVFPASAGVGTVLVSVRVLRERGFTAELSRSARHV